MTRQGMLVIVIAASLLVGACVTPWSDRPRTGGEPGKSVSADRTAVHRRTYPPARPVMRRNVEVAVAPLAARPSRHSVSVEPLQATRKQYRPIPADGAHRVAAKETVYAISRLYGVPVRSLIRANGLRAPYGLRIGQTVRLPTQRTHLVARGETVYGIARKYGVSLNELVKLNGVAKPYVVRVGETLLLPDGDEPGEETRLASAPATGSSALPSIAPKLGEQRVRPAPSEAVRPAVAIPRPAGLSRKGFLWPVEGRLISRFGAKGKGLYNDGINIAVARGAPVRAAQNGVVVYRGNELRGFGNLLLLKHADGYMTAYGHNSRLLVQRGQKVRRGQVIAHAGSSGNVAHPQLHFEIRKRRRAVDPLKYLGRQQASTHPPAQRTAMR